MSLITTIIDGLAPSPSTGLGGANEGYIQGFQDDMISGVAGGVVNKTGGQCLITQNSPLGMSVLIADGIVYVPNADYVANVASEPKFYRVVIKDEDPIAIPSNSSGDVCQHGIDIVIDKVTTPNEYASNVASIAVTLGTPGAGAPSIPDNGYRLAEVEVVDGATQIANASITDTRVQIAINTLTLGDVATLTGTQTLTNKTLTSPVLTTPKVVTSINDANGNEIFETPATTNAVNQLKPIPSATGNAVQLAVSGGDDNISLNLVPKGTGTLQYAGNLIATFAQTRFKIGTFTRAQTGTAGDVGYTGVGFQPTAIIFFMSPGTTDMSYYSSWGFSDASVNYCTVVRAAVNSVVATSCIFTGNGTSDQRAIVKTFDADGFTLTWAISGTPATANMTIYYLALR